MKTTYIPKGETVEHTQLVTEKLIVDGCLRVNYDVIAKTICGNGAIFANRIYADTISMNDIDCLNITCDELLAKRVNAVEVFASRFVGISCMLIATLVRTGTLRVAMSEVDEIEADDVIHLQSHRGGMLSLLIRSAWSKAWHSFITPNPKHKVMDAEYTVEAEAETDEDDTTDSVEETTPVEEVSTVTEDETLRSMIADTVRAVLDERDNTDSSDFELKRMTSMFKLCREEGCTLKVVPGTPEENAPIFQPVLKSVA